MNIVYLKEDGRVVTWLTKEDGKFYKSQINDPPEGNVYIAIICAPNNAVKANLYNYK